MGEAARVTAGYGVVWRKLLQSEREQQQMTFPPAPHQEMEIDMSFTSSVFSCPPLPHGLFGTLLCGIFPLLQLQRGKFQNI